MICCVLYYIRCKNFFGGEIFLSDPKRNPEGCFVVLIRNYAGPSYNLTGQFDQNEVCVVTECGLSELMTGRSWKIAVRMRCLPPGGGFERINR